MASSMLSKKIALMKMVLMLILAVIENAPPDISMNIHQRKRKVKGKIENRKTKARSVSWTLVRPWRIG
jgi:hypothetical protein